MPQREACLICYDVRDPKRLRRVARLTEGSGQRAQRSVFEAWLTRDHQAVWQRQADKLTTAEDALILVRLCPRCARRVQVLGQGGKFVEPDADIV